MTRTFWLDLGAAADGRLLFRLVRRNGRVKGQRRCGTRASSRDAPQPIPGGNMSRSLTRRAVLKTAAAASTVAIAAPFVRGAYAAGKLSCGFWDHWVPTALDPMRKLCQEWADKNHVELGIDFITSNGDKILLTIAAEAQAKSGQVVRGGAAEAGEKPGHEVSRFPPGAAPGKAENLEPMDDIMQSLIAENGQV